MDLLQKMQIKASLPKQEAFDLFVSDKKNWYNFIHEYEMDFIPYGNKEILKLSLSSEDNKYVETLTKYLCKNTNLKFGPTKIGKSAEVAFKNCVNSLFYLFRINKKLVINDTKYLYGGDGGGDFFLGSRVFDIKYRNDSPAHGMILEDDFLDRTQDSVVLIHVTNSQATKISDVDLEQNLPLAISGWTTVADFKKNAAKINNGRRSKALDNMNPIDSLLLDILKEFIQYEAVFEWPSPKIERELTNVA